jgi:ribulose kinase
MIKFTIVALALGTALFGAVATGAHARSPLSAQPSAVHAERSDAIAPVAAQYASIPGLATDRE